ncbi:MAG: periplasmic protein [Rickettsiaceae bacterium]|jgi:hyperosmotically inducible protein|nr:periplasmic protein [Rickettsiaceae bacterium]
MKIIKPFIVLVTLALTGFNTNAYAHTESSKAKNIIPDTTITAAIKGKYALDEKVNALDMSVKTINGKVYLKGKIPDRETGERAMNIALNTNGVKEVFGEFEGVWRAAHEKSTPGNIVSDSAITAAIKSKYALDERISTFDIHVTTVNGKVTLKGDVSDLDVLERAYSIAQNTNGVKEVHYKFNYKR